MYLPFGTGDGIPTGSNHDRFYSPLPTDDPRARSSAWIERRTSNPMVVGSNPIVLVLSEQSEE